MTIDTAMAAALAAADARTLRDLHRPGKPVVLPNIWDAASAALVQAAGFPAVATSSATVAESLGYEDMHAPVDEMLAAAARIARAVDVPVTVDAEAGYGLPAAELVDRLIAACAAGCNLEDTDHATGELADVAAHARWLASVRDAATKAEVPLVVNARIDVFLRAGFGPEVDQAALVGPAVERARAYLAAGADCVYPILLRDPAAIRAFVAAVDGPVNLLSFPGGLSVADAAKFGAARVSMGTAMSTVAKRALSSALAEIMAQSAAT
jgi:2-methylisocitrate lyase-like PEP mutase family enzyme